MSASEPKLPVTGRESEVPLLHDKDVSTQPHDDDSNKDDLENKESEVSIKVHVRAQSEGSTASGKVVKVNGSAAPSESGESYANGWTKNGEIPKSMSGSSTVSKHRIKLEEVAPSASSLVEDYENDWKVSLNLFTPIKRGKQDEDKKLPRRIRRYYKRQDELISAFEEMQLEVDDAMENAEEETRLKRLSRILAKATFFINLILLIAKAVAAGLSGSLSIISSVIDSAVDLISGALMWWSSQAMKNRDPYTYPQGRTKLEPIAIVVLSVVMSLGSVQMIRESVEMIIRYSTVNSKGPVVELPTILIAVFTIVIKFGLWIGCRRIKNSSIQALSQDHRNDVLSNTIAIICGYIGDKYWKFCDPVGAIVISVYIIVSWSITGMEQIKMLTGHTARPDFLKKITWIALNHHPQVLLIDTVRAFHFGNNFLVEVDIVLPEHMTLRESHDIGETLQIKIERLTEVERAFVHLDYECEHDPTSEHKVV